MSFNIKRTNDENLKVYLNGRFAGYSDKHPMDYPKVGDDATQVTPCKKVARQTGSLGLSAVTDQMSD